MITEISKDLTKKEVLAAQVHVQWSSWMKYLFEQGRFNEDGTWTMNEWAVNRWIRQMLSSYDQLSEKEKESDRREVEIYLKELVGLLDN